MYETRFTRINNWVELGSCPDANNSDYVFLRVPDYIFVLCIGKDGKIPLVHQFRIPQNTTTLELPAGLIEEENPLEAGVREAKEEVGLLNFEQSKLLGPYVLDTGRISNKTYFLILDECEFESNFEGEKGVNVEFVSLTDLKEKAINNKLSHLGQVAAVLICFELGLMRIGAKEQ